MVDRAPETVAEIASRTGRPLTTVKNTWTRHPAWPDPLPQRRGRWRLYDPADVDAFIRDHIDRQVADLEPTRLYTAQQLEDAGIGIRAGTIRSDLTRRRWPEPDDTEGGTNRWYGATVTEALAGRRGYRRTEGE
ncbi:hypothetical protein [Streptomyces cylindrosporus]|uniref:HTH merR-type domain-containing protein n=1 Tax=Streptomyces cylindrosporus TaxID=2927583 RepID=A0ABS9YJR8_9ACTN|nr:hypothetical protein [Streptomyces cylindrosporus]MCI3277508.1 hypothetical protein [Streptomyces cylindrosporus]